MKTRTKRTVKVATCFLSAGLTLCVPITAFAGTYDIQYGNITITAAANASQTVTYYESAGGPQKNTTDPDPTVTGTSDQHTVTINAEADATANVTFDGLSINAISKEAAAVTVSGAGSVSIELEGTNNLTAGEYHAALEDQLNGTLTINDADADGTLSAKGSYGGAGIGGGNKGDGSKITITGGTVTADGGDDAAGIGGGKEGDGSKITITGGTVIATGGHDAAGIGGGEKGTGSDIKITGGTVTATGIVSGAGIGGGKNGNGSEITITGGTVAATGGYEGSICWDAAGIGGGKEGDGSKITITGGTVIATGGHYGAGIGGGEKGTGSDIKITGGTVTATGIVSGAGIGGGKNGNGSTITITGGTVTATSGKDGAGIGGGNYGAGSGITISGGIVTATSGKEGAGIGGGNEGTGSGITISGGIVTATSGKEGAGIGGGSKVVSNGGEGKNIKISGSAKVRVAGGAETRSDDCGYGAGAAIGDGGSKYDPLPLVLPPGKEAEIDTSGLYTTGSITKYAPGTTADDITQYPDQGIMERIVGTVIDPNTPKPKPDPAPVTSQDPDEEFNASICSQIDDLLKQLDKLLKAGRIDEARALMAKGFVINAGTHKGLNSKTLEKLGELSCAGVVITINYTYKGDNYRITIPAGSRIDPASLVGADGYCSFRKLMEYFG